MQWLNVLVGQLLAGIGLDLDGYVGGVLQFFIYDSIKIFLLLGVLIFTITYIQSYFPPERTRSILGRYTGIPANTISALLGTVTPFCSCSSIPLFMGFTRAGLPLGVTFSFLISSPLVDLASLVLLTSIFGVEVALAYVVAGLIIAIAGGTVIERLGLDDQLEPIASVNAVPGAEYTPEKMTRRDRAQFALGETSVIARRVAPYVFVGVGLGAAIHNVIPQSAIEAVLGSGNPFSVLLATAVGIPLYADVFGTIPIAEALYGKGVGIGTILALIMAVTALSLPSMVMLRRVVKPKLLAIFVGIVATGIIVLGYGFNAAEALFW